MLFFLFLCLCDSAAFSDFKQTPVQYNSEAISQFSIQFEKLNKRQNITHVETICMINIHLKNVIDLHLMLYSLASLLYKIPIKMYIVQ